MLQIITENKLGSDCTGSDGTPNRVLTLSNTYTTVNNGLVVSLGGFIQDNSEYLVTNLSASSTILFLKNVYNSSPIIVNYFQDAPDPSSSTVYGMDPLTENWLGSNCTGNDGDTNRKLVIDNQRLTSGTGFLVFLGGFAQGISLDYTVSHLTQNTEITFLGRVHNESPIEILYFTSSTTPAILELSKKIQNFKNILNRHGQTANLRKVVPNRDGMGGVTSYTNSDYTIRWLQQPITEKDRNLIDMGLAVAGDMKAFFYPYYTSTDTGVVGPNITVETGDIITDSHSIKWRLEQKLGGRIADGTEIFAPCIVKKMDLTN